MDEDWILKKGDIECQQQSNELLIYFIPYFKSTKHDKDFTQDMTGKICSVAPFLDPLFLLRD